MGGVLEVQSVVGEGSRFRFALPLVEAPEPVSSGNPERSTLALDARLAPGESVAALVVDDNTASRRILASLLESAGVRVMTAAGGVEALQLAEVHHPEVILMDLKMPDLDGLEATRRLRQDPRTATIPVIAVTASALGDVRQTVHDAGCVDYLSKPVRAELLFAMLERHLGVRFMSETEPASRGDARAIDLARRIDIAARLRHAVGLGDVGEIRRLARDLMAGDPGEAAVGERIDGLVINFDFGGLNELADSLAP